MCSANSSWPGGGPSKITSAPTCMCDALLLLVRGTRRRSRSGDPCGPVSHEERTTRDNRVREAPRVVLVVQVVLGVALVALVATDNLPFTGDDEADAAPRAERTPTASTAPARLEAAARAGGARPAPGRLARLAAARAGCCAGSSRTAASRRSPAACATWSGPCPAASRGYVVVGAHYDTKDIPGFVGANDGACGTAVAVQLARTLRPPLRQTVEFVALRRRGEPARHAGRAVPARGLRGQQGGRPRASADAEAMVLLDFVGDRTCASRARATRPPRCGASCAARGAPPRARSTSSRARPAARCSTTTCRSCEQRRAVDRPDRLRLPLLAPPLRRPVRRLASGASTRAGRPVRAASLASL